MQKKCETVEQANIEYELEKIIEKYNMQTYDFLRDRFANAIREIIKQVIKKKGSRVIIRGLKESKHKYHPLLKLISEEAQVIAVVDKNPFAESIQITETLRVPFFNSDLLNIENQCDCYIINALYSGKDIYNQIKKELHDKDIQVLDIYTAIRIEYSLAPSKTLEEYYDERDFTHNRLQESIEEYRKKHNLSALRRVLAVCLSMRDFITYFRIIKEAEELVKEDIQLIELTKEIEELLEFIKKKVKERTSKPFSKKSIVLHWIDQVSYDEICLFPKVKRKIEEGLFFENAYTVTPYTKPTVRTIFWKEYRGLVENATIGKYEVNLLEDSKLYQIILKNEYKFNVFGMIKEILDKKFKGNEKTEFSMASSIHYWDMLNQLIQETESGVYIVHILNETHEPYISPEVGLENESYEFKNSYSVSSERIKRSAEYADEIIDFYSTLLGDNIINIYMSDHGKWEDIDRRRYKNHAMHTLFGITNLGIKGRMQKLFCYQNFDKLMSWIFDMAKPEEMFFCDIPIYSSGFRAVIKERVEDDTEICSGYKGIQNSKEKYIKLENGQEIYYVNGNEEENLIENFEYKKQISNIRNYYEDLKSHLMKNC